MKTRHRLNFLLALSLAVSALAASAAVPPQQPTTITINSVSVPAPEQPSRGKAGPVLNAEISSIAGSTIHSDDVYTPSATATVCFTAYNASTDLEWIRAITLTFPSAWTVGCNSQDATDSGGSIVDMTCAALFNQLTYTDSNGGDGEILGKNNWGFCADVTAPAAASGSQPVDWEQEGDYYGAEPHTASGTLEINMPAPSFSLSHKSTQSVVVPGDVVTYTLTLTNSGQIPANNASLVDPIPPNTTFAYLVEPPTASYDSGQNQIEWTGTVTNGTGLDVTFAVTVSDEVVCGTTLTNTATLTDPATYQTATLAYTSQARDIVYYYGSFEGDDGGFTSSGANSSWAWGAVGTYVGSRRFFPTNAHSGENVWGTNLTGDYNTSEQTYLTSPPIDLSSAVIGSHQRLWLEWWQWLYTESGWDWGQVHVRGGTTGWTLLDPPGRMDGELDLSWGRYAADISSFAGVSDFQVRFRFYSDYYIEYPGWYVDDVVIHQCAPPPGLYLVPETLALESCNGLTRTHTFNLANWTGSTGIFNLTYTLANPAYGAIDGPSTASVAAGMVTSVPITVSPQLCLPEGLELAAIIQASGNGFTGTAHLTKTIRTGTLSQWVAAAPTAPGTRFHAASAHDGNLYRVGGETNQWTPTDTVDRYDLSSGTWTTATAMITGAYGIDAATIGDHIYVPGGNVSTVDPGASGPRLDALQVYSTTAETWSLGTPMTTALAYASAVAYDGKLYVIGGQDDEGVMTDTLYIYDPATEGWSSGTAMSQARGYAAAAAIGDKIYVAGGFDGNQTLDSLEIYDPVTDSWSAGPALPKAWAPFGDGAVNDRYFAIFNGGTISFNGNTDYACGDDAYYYDTTTGEWIALPDLNRCSYGAQGAAIGPDLYVIGGQVLEFTPLMTTEVDRLAFCPLCTRRGWLEGHVLDYGSGLVCTDATVQAAPGNQATSVISSTGYYTFPLVPLDYQATASAAGYPAAAGPEPVTISDGVTTTQDFTLGRPDVTVSPTAAFVSSLDFLEHETHYFTLTNSGSYTLTYSIQEQLAPPGPTILSEELNPPIAEAEIEPSLQAQLNAGESPGYLIYLRERPDLSPAYQMDWRTRGRFVMKTLQEAAERSQARVRAYLDAHRISYQAFWIDNVIAVESSNQATLSGLTTFSEVQALRARRQPALHQPLAREPASFSPLAIEPNITHVQADQVWNLGFRGEGVVVANIDSGVRYSHEALFPQYRGNDGDHNYDWWDPYGDHPSSPADDNGHGSHTMGTMIGDDNGDNHTGMAPDAQWIACRGCSTATCGDAELLECAQWVAAPWNLSGLGTENPDLRPHVVNNSWGDCLTSLDDWYKGVVANWHAAGIYPVFSNGNASNCSYSEPPGLNTVGNPARYGNVTGVGSTGRNDGQYAPHSNWGPTDDPDTVNPRGYPNLKPQVVAPGVNIRSAVNSGDAAYTSMGGTSMSAPHVTGLVALMWGAAPCLVGDYASTETIIEETATPISYNTGNGDEGPGNVPNHAAGWGEINALAAVQAAQARCPTDVLDWVETDVVTGTLTTGDQPVALTFKCTPTATVQPQPLWGTLRVSHNDPCAEPVEIGLELTCTGQPPQPAWEKRVWANDTPADTFPVTIAPSDTVRVADQVWITFTGEITFTLFETWSESLALASWELPPGSHLLPGIDVVSSANALTWTVAGLPGDRWYAITKTFDVLSGPWQTSYITERLRVENVVKQLDPRTLSFQRADHTDYQIYLPLVLRND